MSFETGVASESPYRVEQAMFNSLGELEQNKATLFKSMLTADQPEGR